MSWSVFNHWLCKKMWNGRWNAGFYQANTPTVLVLCYQRDITGCRVGRDTISFHVSMPGTGQEPKQEKQGPLSWSFCTRTTEEKNLITWSGDSESRRQLVLAVNLKFEKLSSAPFVMSLLHGSWGGPPCVYAEIPSISSTVRNTSEK